MSSRLGGLGAGGTESSRMYRFVRHEHVRAYEQLGWMRAADLGDYHGQFSCLMEWPCGCPFAEPTNPEIPQ